MQFHLRADDLLDADAAIAQTATFVAVVAFAAALMPVPVAHVGAQVVMEVAFLGRGDVDVATIARAEHGGHDGFRHRTSDDRFGDGFCRRSLGNEYLHRAHVADFMAILLAVHGNLNSHGTLL